MMPFMVLQMLAVILIALVPQIAVWLPGVMEGTT